MFNQGGKSLVSLMGVQSITPYYQLLVASLLFVAGQSNAGVFLLETPNSADDGEKIVHSHGYNGVGGNKTVRVCLSPGSPDLDKMEPIAKKVVATWNGMTPTTGNLRTGNQTGMAPGQIDFESLLLHEMGHCMGLGHPNMSGGAGRSEATVGGSGSDGTFQYGAGEDYILGSQDDDRGDDTNYHRFAPGVNDPFRSVGAVVDRTTYTRDLAQLPNGHNFARNGARAVASRMGLAPTEVVMQQGSSSQETQRQLSADDVDTLRYARSGLDGIQGTSDDYEVTLVYDGIQNGCDIQIKQESLSPGALGYCTRGSMSNLSSEHFAFAGTATIRANSNVNWHYADAAPGNQYPFLPATCPSTPQSCSSAGQAKMVAKPGKFKLVAREGGPVRFQIPDEGTNFAACLYEGGNLVKQWDMPGPEGWRITARAMKHKAPGLRFKGGSGRMKFKTRDFDSALSGDKPVDFQVVTGIGQCWEASFSEVTPHPKKPGLVKAVR